VIGILFLFSSCAKELIPAESLPTGINPINTSESSNYVTETCVQPFYNVHPASLSTAPNRSYYYTIGSFFAMAVFYDAVQDYRRLSDCYIETKQKLLVG